MFIEDETDIDVRNELIAQIEYAKEQNIDDIVLLKNLFDIGFTWKTLEYWLDEKELERFKAL